MVCYTPLTAGFTSDRDITFNPELFYGSPLTLPCGQCIGCRLERSRHVATRAMHELSLKNNIGAFLTLTYSPKNIPKNNSLDPEIMPLFFRRLKRHVHPKKISYMYCGEYGDKFDRPHYHALVFNHDFQLSLNKGVQNTFWSPTSSNDDDKLYLEPVSHHELGSSYESPELNSLWKLGHASVGTLTYESAAYVARYCLKKVNGHSKNSHYKDRIPEFMHYSQPGIGKGWIQKYYDQVAAHGDIIVNGRRQNIPRYYLKQLEKISPELYDELKLIREAKSRNAQTTRELYNGLVNSQARITDKSKLTFRDNYFVNYYLRQLRRDKFQKEII